jgi:peptidyl-tRNA hydrolase, PTH1 family
MSIKLIVGLGNPGKNYEKTLHNAGVWFLEYLADAHHSTFKTEKHFHGLMTSMQLDKKTYQLLYPTTFMNHSGRSVQAVSHFYQYQPEEILVAHDDLDLPTGTVRLKLGGGHGGHNGLRDIIQCLGSAQFFRLRIGIGHPGHKDQVLNYVLGTPSGDDKERIDDGIARTARMMNKIVTGDIQKAMTELHTEQH